VQEFVSVMNHYVHRERTRRGFQSDLVYTISPESSIENTILPSSLYHRFGVPLAKENAANWTPREK